MNDGTLTTDYLWDEFSAYGDVVRETNVGGTTAFTLAGGTLISQTFDDGINPTPVTSYFLTDAIGSTRMLTDAGGTPTESFEYDAFGELLGEPDVQSLGTDYLYAGQQFDPMTELYSMRARYYDSSVGRFMSRDTWAYDYGNPVELNRYVYTANNPVNNIDPSGHMIAGNAIKHSSIEAVIIKSLFALGTTVFNTLATPQFILFILSAVIVGSMAIDIPIPGIAPPGIGVPDDVCGSGKCDSFLRGTLEKLEELLAALTADRIRNAIDFTIWADGGKAVPVGLAIPNVGIEGPTLLPMYRAIIRPYELHFDGIGMIARPEPILRYPYYDPHSQINMIRTGKWASAFHVYITFRFGGTNVTFDNNHPKGWWGVWGDDRVKDYLAHIREGDGRRVTWRNCRTYQGLTLNNVRKAMTAIGQLMLQAAEPLSRTEPNRVQQNLWNRDDCPSG